MTKKTIWYCHPTAGSPQEGMSYRPYYLCKYWKKAGHQAYVISSSFHHLLHQPQYQKEDIHLKVIDGVDYIRLKTPDYKGNGFKRIISMLAYALQITRQQKKIFQMTGKPDAIIVSSTHPFHYLSLYPIAKKNQIPLIFEVRDLWPSSLIELLNLKKWHPLVIILSCIEKHAYQNVDGVVSLLADAKPYMVAKGLNPEKFAYIPNGTDCENNLEEKSLPKALQICIDQHKKNHQFLIGYAGALGLPNAMEHFIQAMAILQKTHPHVQALLVGKGGEKDNLMNYCQIHQLHNVHFFDPIPKTQVHHFLKEMDLLYLGWQDTKLYQYGVSPNKMFDYMLAGKPILESGGADTSIIGLAQCGQKCTAADVHSIAKNIIELMETDPKALDKMGYNGFNYILKYHSYQNLQKDYTDFFNKIRKNQKNN